MGYDFTIGEAAIHEPPIEECDELATLRVHVAETVRDDAAPQGWNRMSCGYRWWVDAMRESGLGDIAVVRGGLDRPALLMPYHPGAARLTHNHLARFEAAHQEALRRNSKDSIEATAWLVWWTRWALANCKIPTLANR